MGKAYLQLGPAFAPHKGTYCCLHFIEEDRGTVCSRDHSQDAMTQARFALRWDWGSALWILLGSCADVILRSTMAVDVQSLGTGLLVAHSHQGGSLSLTQEMSLVLPSVCADQPV